MITIGLILLSIYCGMLLFLLIGYFRLPVFLSNKIADIHGFSIIIPFRNEAEQLPELLTSLQKLIYSEDKFELIFVNDASEDASVAIISKTMEKSPLRWTILQNERISNSPKKDALTLAISKALFPWILTTDADCQAPKNWLQFIDRLIQEKNPKMICGPVAIREKNGLVRAFQISETISLQGITMGGFGWSRPLLCNGANLAFTKDAFDEVNGYSGNEQIASGDDIFLMEKFRRHFPQHLEFLKSPLVTVTTKAELNWKAVVSQRIRWAAKTTKQDNGPIQLIGLIAFATNLWLVAGFFGLFFSSDGYPYPYFDCFLLKIFIDVIFVLLINTFFRSRLNPLWLLLNALLYPFITSGIAIRSLFGSYQWKGRHFER